MFFFMEMRDPGVLNDTLFHSITVNTFDNSLMVRKTISLQSAEHGKALNNSECQIMSKH